MAGEPDLGLGRTARNLLLLIFSDDVTEYSSPTLSLTLKSSSKFAGSRCPKCTAEAEFLFSKKKYQSGTFHAHVLFFDLEMMNFAYYETSQWILRLDWIGTSRSPAVSRVCVMDKQGKIAVCSNTDFSERLKRDKGMEPLEILVTSAEGHVSFEFEPDLPHPNMQQYGYESLPQLKPASATYVSTTSSYESSPDMTGYSPSGAGSSSGASYPGDASRTGGAGNGGAPAEHSLLKKEEMLLQLIDQQDWTTYYLLTFLLLTTYYLLLTTYHLLLTAYYILTTYYLLLTTDYMLQQLVDQQDWTESTHLL